VSNIWDNEDDATELVDVCGEDGRGSVTGDITEGEAGTME
jgi:hypothetical protein